MPVEDRHRGDRVAPRREELVHGAEWVIRRCHERAADRVHDEGALRHERAAPGIVRRQVERAQHEVEALDLGDELPLVPDVVASGDHVGAARPQLARDLGREPGSAGRVLAVHDRQIDAELRPKARKQRSHGIPSRPADDVTDEQDAHRSYFA